MRGQGGTILVTGATGSIGRRLVPALRNAGFAVRGQFVRKAGEDPAVDWRQWDLGEKRDLAPLLRGCSGVIHLAAAIRDIPVMERLNVQATREIAQAAVRDCVRYFCHASSIVVYGSPLQRQIDETSPVIDPERSLAEQYRAEPYMLEYARTKVLSERVLHEFAPPLHVDIVRPVVVADDAKFREVLHWSLPRKLLSLHRRTQYVHVDDVAAALVHLLMRGLGQPGGAFETYNICDEQAGTYRELLALLTAGRIPHLISMLRVPEEADLLKDAIKHRSHVRRYPLGLLRISSERLSATGFEFPIGYGNAVVRAAEPKMLRR